MTSVPVGVAAAPVGEATSACVFSALGTAAASSGSTLTMTLVAAPAAAPAMKRCSKRKGSWQCANRFPADDPCKTCSHHRKKSNDFAKSSKGKVINKRSKSKHKKEIAKSDAKYKSKNKKQIAESAAEYRTKNKKQLAESGAEYRTAHKKQLAESGAEYRTAHKKQIAKSKAEYWTTPAGRASQKKDSARLISLLSKSMRKMVRDTPNAGATPLSRGLFVSDADAQTHFRSTFAPWMTMKNRGAHRRGAPYKTKWQLGHLLPKAIFDPSLIADVDHCFSRRNLIAQDARENQEQRDSLALSDAQLLALQPLWPAAAGGELGALKALFARVAKARAEAAEDEEDEEEEDEEASSDGEEEDEDEEDEDEEDEDEEDEDESSDDDEM